jgi:hypothetical protein
LAHKRHIRKRSVRVQVGLFGWHHWPIRDALSTAVFGFIEVFSDCQRRHSHLGHLGPVEFERRWRKQEVQAQVTSP